MESTQVRNCESPRNSVQVSVDLDRCFLSGVFGVGLVSQDDSSMK